MKMKNKYYILKSFLLFLLICICYFLSLVLLLKNLNIVELYEITILFSLCIFSLIFLVYSIFIKNKLLFFSAILILIITFMEIIIIKFNIIIMGIESITWLNIVFQSVFFLIYIFLLIGLFQQYKTAKRNYIIRLLAFDNYDAILFTYNFDEDTLDINLSKELKMKRKIKEDNVLFSREKFLKYILEEDHGIFNKYLNEQPTEEAVIVIRFIINDSREFGYMTFKDGIKIDKKFIFLGIDTTLLQKSLTKIEDMDKSKAVMLENLDLGVLELELINENENEFIASYTNKAFEKELNFKNTIVNKNIKNIFPLDYKDLSTLFISIINKNEQQEQELFYALTNTWYRLRGYKSDVSKIVLIFDDISSFKKQEKEQEYKIYHDSLTDLYNNRGLHGQLRAYKDSKKLICFYIDLVNFSWINNYYSMAFSDNILVIIAEELKKYFSKDVIISRYFTDHFVIILKEPTDEEIQSALQFLKETSGKTYEYGRNSVSVRKNIGYAIYPDDTQNIKEVIFLANLAMKMSIENTGAAPFHYFPGLKEFKEEKIKNIEMLKDAIQNKNITVYFQKIIDVRNNHIVMVEALARWKKPDGSFVPPLTFIKLAIDARIINLLETLLISESLRKYSELIKMDEYKNTKLSLNLSPTTFLNTDTIDLINGYLNAYNLSPGKIYIEISEETFVYNISKCNHAIDLYRKNGFRISIDDFGTSYSSLTILNNIDYEVLKIDGKFIQNYKMKKNQEIIEMIIKIASIDNKRIVAEGVETKEMVEYLKSVSCFVHQGYYFHFPENIIE